MINPRKLIAAAAALVIAVSTSGCSAMLGLDSGLEKYPDPVNTPISADVKWINSSIDETLETSLKDDFYTYVLKDWLLETKVTDDDQTKSTADYYDSQSILNNRKLMILKGETDPEANEEVTIGVDEADIELCKNIVERYYKEFSDYDSHTDT